MEPPDVEWIAGFAWPVPRAFSGPVSVCRFEQGDVLYDDASGYGRWTSGDAPQTVIQVLEPPKTARGGSGDAEGNRFQVNWGLPVTVDVYADGAERPERRTTTQGRLFACLWRGDPAMLDEAVSALDAPLSVRELHRRLAEAVPAFVKRLRKRARRGGHSLLLLAVDDASDAARVKARAIEGLLRDAFDVEALTLTPAEAGLEDADALHPALGVRGIAITTEDTAAVERCLCALLYGGGDEGAGRFSLARHGHLGPLAEG